MLSQAELDKLPLDKLRLLAEAGSQELARKRAKDDLPAWARLAGFDPAPHHGLLLARLTSMSGGHPTCQPGSVPAKLGEVHGYITGQPEIGAAKLRADQDRGEGGSLSLQQPRNRATGGRLMVFMPPGSAKSTYCSILFPAWFLGQEGGGNVLAASHSTELAERFGRKVRNLAAGHSSALGYSISADSGAAGRWETSTGREYYAAGSGVGIAGFRAKLGIIDDPFRGRADAESKTTRDRIWEWYNDDFDPRCTPGAHQILIMTRYHEDDLAGRLMQRGGWDVLSLPAIAGEDDPLGRMPGEWLWEGEYGYADQLRAKFAQADSRSWASLYQQDPVPDTGAYFDASWIKHCTHMPDRSRLRFYGASDYAVTQRGGDFTVHVVVGIDPKGRLYVVDLWRGQTDSAEWVKSWIDLVKKWKPFEWAEESGQIRSSIGPFLEVEAGKARAYTYRRQFPSKHDKAVRAQSIRARMSMGGLYVPEGAPWLAEFEHELLRFPAAVHDDQVDALGLIGQLLDDIQAPAAHEDLEDVLDLKPGDYEFALEDDDDDEEELNWKVL